MMIMMSNGMVRVWVVIWRVVRLLIGRIAIRLSRWDRWLCMNCTVTCTCLCRWQSGSSRQNELNAIHRRMRRLHTLSRGRRAATHQRRTLPALAVPAWVRSNVKDVLDLTEEYIPDRHCTQQQDHLQSLGVFNLHT